MTRQLRRFDLAVAVVRLAVFGFLAVAAGFWSAWAPRLLVRQFGRVSGHHWLDRIVGL